MDIGYSVLVVALSLSSLAPGYAASSALTPQALGPMRAAPWAGTPELPPGCDAPLTLTLQPGFNFDHTDLQIPGGFHPPADAPPGPASLQLPLYPGAMPSTHVFSGSLFSFGANHYLKSRTAAFQISADEGAAESWYRQSFAACGYVVQAIEGPTARGVGIGFYSTLDRHASAWIVLEPNASGGTFVLYVGEMIVLPPRPRDSYLPGDSVRVQLRYIPPTTPEPPYPVERFTILRRAIIDQLVSEINALTDVAGGGVMGCTWYGTTTLARLRFVRRSGKSVTVRVQPGCALVIVGHTRPLIDGLADAYFPVWNGIKQVVAECQDKRC